jgi:hypothetical protein
MNVIAWIGFVQWRLMFVAATLASCFVVGCQFGVARERTEGHALEMSRAVEVARQTSKVQEVISRQTVINKEISDEFDRKKAVFADLHPVVRDGLVRMRIDSPGDQYPLPLISRAADRAEASSADALPDPLMKVDRTACDRLAQDATETTLMLLEIQRWYEKQSNEK